MINYIKGLLGIDDNSSSFAVKNNQAGSLITYQGQLQQASALQNQQQNAANALQGQNQQGLGAWLPQQNVYSSVYHQQGQASMLGNGNVILSPEDYQKAVKEQEVKMKEAIMNSFLAQSADKREAYLMVMKYSEVAEAITAVQNINLYFGGLHARAKPPFTLAELEEAHSNKCMEDTLLVPSEEPSFES